MTAAVGSISAFTAQRVPRDQGATMVVQTARRPQRVLLSYIHSLSGWVASLWQATLKDNHGTRDRQKIPVAWINYRGSRVVTH